VGGVKNRVEFAGVLSTTFLNSVSSSDTLSENENEWPKTEQVPISFHRAPRNFSDAKTRNRKKLDIGDNPIYLFE
jgi:hypothetical protein